ncbi:hypothetical protein [Paenibacillus hubeiensis]|uniref:hypothetical protein n=1 Tax=Paenibacillus hubeiensis TaxID=3077330 RepID=UPI0031BB1891
MKGKLEEGRTYDCVVSGQIWSFTVVEVDEDNEANVWITWNTDDEEQEECHSVDSLLKKIEEHKNNIIAGVIYPRGDSEEAQANALSELLARPRYSFAQMELPRAFVLTDYFSPEGYRPDREYLDFVFDPDTSILKISSTDPAATIPGWVLDRFNVVAVTKVNPEKRQDKVVYLLKMDQAEDKQ